MFRRIYRWIIRLHPPQFRNHFGDEMLSIFDDAAKGATLFKVMTDGLASLARQWMFRWECSRDRLAEPVQPCGGVVPVFFVLDDYKPRTKPVLAGGMLTLIAFCAVWLVSRYTWTHPVFMPEMNVQFASSSNTETPTTSPWLPGLTGARPNSQPAIWPSSESKSLKALPATTRTVTPQISTAKRAKTELDPNRGPRALAALILGPQQLPQSPERPSFEVASVKPTRGLPGVAIWGNIHPPAGPISTIVLMNRTTRQLIEIAYNIQDSELTPGPKWIATKRFDIDAKIDDSIVAKALANSLTRTEQLDQARMMLQSLLADRFALKIHSEKKELPVYALTVANGGLKIKPITVPNATSPPRAPSGEMAFATLGSTDIFIDALSHIPAMDGRPIVDRTGLKADYLWTFHWTSDEPYPTPVPPGVALDTPGPSLFTALREQLGLKLEATKGPVDVLVIDHVAEPTPN